MVTKCPVEESREILSGVTIVPVSTPRVGVVHADMRSNTLDALWFRCEVCSGSLPGCRPVQNVDGGLDRLQCDCRRVSGVGKVSA